MRTCYDSIDAANLPTGASLYAGYVDGAWPDYAAIKARFPSATVIGITVFPQDNIGDCLDVEPGDASPTEAPAWVTARRKAGHAGPLVYCSQSVWPDIVQAFSNAGVAQPGYWVAAYPGQGSSIPAGAVGHQYASNQKYDTSTFVDYLPGIDPAKPPKPPIVTQYPGDNVQSTQSQIEVKGGAGWFPLENPAPVVSVTVFTDNPNQPAPKNVYTPVPVSWAWAAEPGPQSPNGVVTVASPVDGTFGVLIWQPG